MSRQLKIIITLLSVNVAATLIAGIFGPLWLSMFFGYGMTFIILSVSMLYILVIDPMDQWGGSVFARRRALRLERRKLRDLCAVAAKVGVKLDPSFGYHYNLGVMAGTAVHLLGQVGPGYVFREEDTPHDQ